MKRLIFGCIAAILACIPAYGQPARVVDLAGSSTNGGIFVSWTATASPGATITNLDMRYDTAPINAFNWSTKPRLAITDPGAPGTVQSAMILGLNPGTNYYVALKEQDSNGLWSLISDQPLPVAGGQSLKVTLAWDVSTDVTVSGYKIYWGVASQLYTNSIDAGDASSVTVSNLTYGTLYYFAVTDYTLSGLESDYSAEVSFEQP
ncbi:MAG: hypothetical protein KGI45_02815 [Patescibacteria group bacterium]|nr:fibronectin type III domain-containing protein [Patescibacteria group bacterium]MDE1940806.1 hypothetical protein [Patescibacteria group bacterium]MDE1966978.1 hypothetical protein [Patescibacteria group bacterium]